MTDFRYPERWLHDRRIVRLTDPHHRMFVTASTWCVANRTNGRILRDELAMIPSASLSGASALVDAGLWQTTDSGWLITVYADTQSSKESLEGLEDVRRRGRERKARNRVEKAIRDMEAESVPRQSRDICPGTGRGTTQARTGQARTGIKSQPPTDAGWDDVKVTPPGSGRSMRQTHGSSTAADPPLNQAESNSSSSAPAAHHLSVPGSEIP